ncbi:MAG: hypothetical protein IJ189_14120 [Clostridia bacterium]|nr:hypothetical protein [Clostridia bacterium]
MMTVNSPNAARKLNLRERQSVNSVFLGAYPVGTTVTLMGYNTDWAHVIVHGPVGFMKAKYPQ